VDASGYIPGVLSDIKQKGAVAMATITDTIDVDVDRSTAYNQWTQFEEFPAFMEGVEEVQQLTDTTLHWVTKVGPAVREYDAVITEQEPDQLIAWKSVSGTDNAGRITFQDIDENTTQITAEITIDPEGLVEKIGEKSGAIEMRVARDLQRFKEFIESRGQETGAWRGSVSGGSATSESDAGASGAGMAGAGMSDAGMSDAGMSDAGMSDAGMSDGMGSAQEGSTGYSEDETLEGDSGYMEGGLEEGGPTQVGSDTAYAESGTEAGTAAGTESVYTDSATSGYTEGGSGPLTDEELTAFGADEDDETTELGTTSRGAGRPADSASQGGMP